MGQRRRSVGRYILSQYEKEVCTHAWRAECSGLRHCSSRRLGLISGLSVFLRYFYSRDTKRQSHAELIAKATHPSLAVHISSDVSVEIFGCPATSKYLPCIRKWLFQLWGSCHHIGSFKSWQRFPLEVVKHQNGVELWLVQSSCLSA